jgi:hypothetical protein
MCLTPGWHEHLALAKLTNRAEIHQDLLSKISLLAELLIEKLAVKDYAGRV